MSNFSILNMSAIVKNKYNRQSSDNQKDNSIVGYKIEFEIKPDNTAIKEFSDWFKSNILVK